MIVLKEEIKYNVKSIIKTNNNTKEELIKIFNEKLLRIIISQEKKSTS